MADWMDLDPAPLDVNVVPLYPEQDPARPAYLNLIRDDLANVTPGETVFAPLAGRAWVKREAELALHLPWCDILDGGTCTANCRGGGL